MPDPVREAAEAISNDAKFRIPAPGEPIAIVDPQLIFDLRAALAEQRQRDERAEAAVAVMEAQDRLEALYATNTSGLTREAHERLLDDITNTRLAAMAARRRWAEVEGRRA